MQTAVQKPDMAHLYVLLRKQVEEAGLTKSTRRQYAIMTAITAMLLSGSMALAIASNSMLGFVAGTLFVAFFAVQFGFIGHDAAHRCIAKNDFIAALYGQFSLTYIFGVSYHHWWQRHNDHHANPNDEELDPDVKNMAFAFSEEHARRQKGFFKLTTRYQDYLLFFLLFFGVYSLKLTSIGHLLKHKNKMHIFDAALLIAHYATFVALPIYIAGWLKGLLFYAIWSALSGFYFGMVFLPNHFGMKTVKTDDDMDFMAQQLITSRDINAPRIFDFLFGGLNYQIEHHLFPSMPRKHLRKAKIIVRQFCKEHNLFYYDQNVRDTYKSLLFFAHKIGLSMRSVKLFLKHAM